MTDEPDIAKRWPKTSQLIYMATAESDQGAWAALECADSVVDAGLRRQFGDMVALRRKVAVLKIPYDLQVIFKRCPTLGLLFLLLSYDWALGAKLLDIVESRCLPV